MGFRRYMRKDDASMRPLTEAQLAEIRELQYPTKRKVFPPKPVRDDLPTRLDGRVPPKPEHK